MWRSVMRIAVVIIVASFLLPPISWASEDELRREITALKAKVAEMDQLKAQIAELQKQMSEQKCSILAQQGTVNEVKQSLIQAVPSEGLIKYAPGEGVELPCGFKLQADATLIIQGTPNANNPGSGNKSQCDASWSADIFIEKAFDDWGLALMHLEPGQSDTVEGVMSLYSNVNRDTNDTSANIPITELWYEHYLFDKQLTITAGKLDPANYLDQNEYAFNECTQFLGRIFRNSPAIEWPNDNTLGASVTVAPEAVPYIAVNASYFNADNTYKNIFDKPFISAELTFMPAKAFKYDENMWGGNYRFYWWYNGLEHSKLVNVGESAADVCKEKNTGFGISFDQMITDIYGVFARLGWERHDINIVSTNPNAAPLEGMWALGAQMKGKYWKRPDDVLAFAIGQAVPSSQYKNSDDAIAAGAGGAPEGHFEVYYNMKLTKNLAISPDFQWIWNPHGISESYQGYANSIFVYGVRAQLDF
ncbi:MAG: carbohydrate porin [Candidatus Omnitrophica bacterium]|nr:carbohydrate porin [Candidatus Omnitrophota bacterium]